MMLHMFYGVLVGSEVLCFDIDVRYIGVLNQSQDCCTITKYIPSINNDLSIYLVYIRHASLCNIYLCTLYSD